MKISHIVRGRNESEEGLYVVASKYSYAAFRQIDVPGAAPKQLKISDFRISLFSPESAK